MAINQYWGGLMLFPCEGYVLVVPKVVIWSNKALTPPISLQDLIWYKATKINAFKNALKGK